LPALVDQLNRLVRIRTTPIGMKMFETVEAMEAVPKIQAAQGHPHHGPDRRHGESAQLDGRHHRHEPRRRPVRVVIGRHPRDDKWLSGDRMAGVWYENHGVRALRQVRGKGGCPARRGPPRPARHRDDLRDARAGDSDDNSLQWTRYKKFEWGCVGESACAAFGGRALSTGEPSA
jgi:hypothetical protein